jgi:eukaryotic-like serine/threonine-protein kinase
VNATPSPLDPTSAEDPRLLCAAQEYLAALEAGQRPDRQVFVARFPEVARELAPYLEALDLLHPGDGGGKSLGLDAPDAELPAEPLGDFCIVRKIGRGGMGIVYEAVQRSLGRRVALKVLPFAAALEPRQLQRFQNEAQAAAQLHHPNIVPVHFVGCERGVHYYAMQLIDGQNLADLIRRLQAQKAPSGPATGEAPTVAVVAAELSTQRATQAESYYRAVAGFAVQAAEALEHAHQFGIIHRDVKPANLMVDVRSNVWVTDFGLAQFHSSAGLTRTGDLLGTLRYMSPEQAAGQGAPLDPRTDVYSLGATLYELLTLEPLFAGDDPRRLLRQILDDEPRPPRSVDAAVPVELETIVLKAVGKDPAERYPTARTFAEDLRRFLEHRPILARRPTLPARLQKWARRHPSVVVAAVALLVLVAVGALLSTALIQAEQTRTSDAYRLERQRAQEAEARFQLARRSVDEMIRISEEELADKPFTQSLRRRLLESALIYYQEFIDLRRGDPEAQTELVATQERVQKVLADLAVLQGAGNLHLLSQPAVLDDLTLTGEQRARVEELAARLDRQRLESFRDFGRISPDERRRKFLELARGNDAEVRQVLSRAQLGRLRQIVLQTQGAGAFRDSKVVAKLKLTAEQRVRIQGIEEESFFGGPPPRPGTPPDEFRKAHEQKLKLARERILALLTPEQVRHWQELTGEPFKGTVPFLPPFGPKGPPRSKSPGDD